jgi:opacity protein-like surface antigen
MQRQFLAGVALVAMAGSAFAADMPLKAVAPVALYDWSGMYIGGVVGGAWGTNDISDPGLGIVGTLLGVPVIQTVNSRQVAVSGCCTSTRLDDAPRRRGEGGDATLRTACAAAFPAPRPGRGRGCRRG